MKTKLLTILTLLVLCVTGAWAEDPTPGNADSKYLDIANYSTIVSSSTAVSSYKYFDNNDGVLVICAGPVTKDGTNQNWITVTNSNATTSNKSWVANGVFKGNAYWKGSNSNAPGLVVKGTQSTPITYSYKVTNCTKVQAYVDGSSSGRYVSMYVYPVSGENYNTRGDELGHDTSTNGSGVEVIEVDGMNANTVYEIFITSNSSSQSFIYELAFYTPVLSDVDAPTSLTCSTQTSTSLTYTWTKAEHASGYIATLYSDSECTSSVATQNLGDVATVTFNTLSASTTYYCKVQSKGDGTTYKVNGGTTTAVSGTTSAKAYTVTAASNNNEWGTASAGAGSLDAGETTDITASAADGYKFSSWAVSGEGAELSSTSTNPTTLTMGTENATVTATFRALYTYAITYNAGANGTGSIDAGEKTEDATFTLSSETFTRDGYIQTGWSLTDGGEKAYDLGGSYTDNAAQTFYPFWTAAYTLTYDANGGMGTMSDTKGAGNVKLTANAYTKSGYTFIGWATSQANADLGTVAYSDKASYTLSEDATIYAVWAENFVYLVPATSGTAPTAKNVAIDMQSGSFGAVMYTAGAKDNTYDESFEYTTNGFALKKGGADSLRVELNDFLKEGSIITIRLHSLNTGSRGLNINKTGNSKVKSIGWDNATEGAEETFSYTVTGTDGLKDTKAFWLQRNNTVLIKWITVVRAQPGAKITASGWNTYSSNKALDLSTIDNGTAYVASVAEGSTVTLTPCTDIVAAGTGLMIKGTAGATFTINTTSGAATFDGTNLLAGLPNGGTVPVAGEGVNYVFGWTDASNPGFYKIESATPTLGAGKAYLHTTSALGSKLGLIFDDGETTNIKLNVNDSLDSDAAMYNLAGQKVSNSYKGIVIVNGKKYVCK
jgi:uncharacterized repeat protein (TIGR02543 family)